MIQARLQLSTPSDREIVMTRDFNAPRTLVFDAYGGETLVTAHSIERDGTTTFSMTVQYASQAARDGAMCSGMEQGVAYGFDRLAELLATLEAK